MKRGNNLRTVRLYVFLAVCILATVCGRKTLFQKIDQGDLSGIVHGQYRGTTRFLREGGECAEYVDAFRREIEAHEDLFMPITEKYFPTYGLKPYRFKFALLDDAEHEMILRYFARLPDHPVFAGCQLQFVYDLDTGNLTRIFVSEVPLE